MDNVSLAISICKLEVLIISNKRLCTYSPTHNRGCGIDGYDADLQLSKKGGWDKTWCLRRWLSLSSSKRGEPTVKCVTVCVSV